MNEKLEFSKLETSDIGYQFCGVFDIQSGARRQLGDISKRPLEKQWVCRRFLNSLDGTKYLTFDDAVAAVKLYYESTR